MKQSKNHGTPNQQPWIYTYFYQLEFWGFVAIPTPVFTFTNLNFGVSLEYLHSYLLLPTGILGLFCNIDTHTCLYELEFWGFIAIPAHVLIFAN
jgi:lipopolysaccharide export LptBFGC system permease protein LptF